MDDDGDGDAHVPVQRHNYRKRFTDAIKGVFSGVVGRGNGSEVGDESVENSSGRLKRQLDFGSGGSSGGDEGGSSTEGSTKSGPVSRRPLIRVVKVGVVTSTAPPASVSIEKLTSSSEETSGGKSSEEGGRKYRKTIRRLRNNGRVAPGLKGKLAGDSGQVDDTPKKNFTLEVVQVERKVVRKEDGNLPLFKNGRFSIQPRLSKVSRVDSFNRPVVVYKPRGVEKKRGSSVEDAPEISSVEKSGGKQQSNERVVVHLNQQIPYNDKDISDEDLKDYHDGHASFGSKGNFTHTIISRNVGGFLPGEKVISIEKGVVKERVSGSGEVYAVPGGRSGGSREGAPFSKVKSDSGGGSKESGDRTSPAIPVSLEDLYRKGHPGVVIAPGKEAFDDRGFDDDVGGGYSGSPFKYDPLVDEPPLKFDPESDRFYGEPVVDKDKVAQSNSPGVVVNRGGEVARESGETGVTNENDREGSREKDAPLRESEERRPDGFYYGRAYNPPDYGVEYDTETSDGEKQDTDDFDFVGLDDNFGGDKFFEFPGVVGGGRGFRRDSKEVEGSGATYPIVDERKERGERDRADDDYDRRFGGGGDREDSSRDYDNGFIHTLQQFDNEIKKLQEEGKCQGLFCDQLEG